MSDILAIIRTDQVEVQREELIFQKTQIVHKEDWTHSEHFDKKVKNNKQKQGDVLPSFETVPWIWIAVKNKLEIVR